MDWMRFSHELSVLKRRGRDRLVRSSELRWPAARPEARVSFQIRAPAFRPARFKSGLLLCGVDRLSEVALWTVLTFSCTSLSLH